MSRLKKLAPLLIISALAIFWFVFFSDAISKWVAGLTSRSRYNGHVIGKVVRAEGSARILHLGDIKFVPSPTEHPVELRDGNQLQTSVDSKAIIILNSQDEIEVGPSALLQFQLWNPQDPNSPIYIRNILGQITLRKAGIKGHAYIVKDGRLYLPGQTTLDRPMALTVLRSAPLDMTLADEQPAADTSDTAKPVSDDEADENAPAKAAGIDPDTLSNEYIDETMAGRQSLLQRCWLSRLKDAPSLNGQIVLQFEISRRGKVKDIRVTDATLDDETLTKCVISVISRITFRQYTGPEISLSYPIKFE